MSEKTHATVKTAATPTSAPAQSPLIQRTTPPTEDLAEVPSIVGEVLASSGQPLDTATQADMGARFGHDFSQVRVHTDARAAESADAVSALAYTVGNDIAFNDGLFAPHTDRGRSLLIHELTHVVQQGDMPFNVNMDAPVTLGPVSDTAEWEAHLAPHHIQAAEHLEIRERVGQPTVYRAGPGEDLSGQSYRIPIRLPAQSDADFATVSDTEARRVLAGMNDLLANKIDRDAGMLDLLLKQRYESWTNRAIGWSVEALSGENPPPPSIFDLCRALLSRARRSLATGNLADASSSLADAGIEWRKAAQKVTTYQEGIQTGGERAITGLQVVEWTAGVTLSVASGGLAAELGATTLLGEASVSAGVAGTYGAAKVAAVQAASHGTALKDWDWGKILLTGLGDAALAFVGKYTEGRLGDAIAGRFGAYLGEALSDGELTAMGLTRDAFLTSGQKFIAKFLAGRGSDLLKQAITIVAQRFLGKEHPPLDEVASEIVKELANESAKDIFKDVVVKPLLTGVGLLKGGE